RSDPHAPTAVATEPRRWKLAAIAALAGAGIAAATVVVARREDAPVVAASLDAAIAGDASADATAIIAHVPVRDAAVDAVPDAAALDAGIAEVKKPKGRPKLTKEEIDLLVERPALIAIKNPKAFDPFAYYKTALAEAKRVYPKMWPWALNFGGVDRAGKIDLTTEDVTYAFATDDPAAGKYCLVIIGFEAGVGRIQRASSSNGCGSGVSPPRCSPAEVWRRATDAGLPATATHARFHRIGRMWRFSSGEFGKHIPDDCEP
ncbi:MAG TPA: hypothetical protein VIU61_23510, partial [Kofleriaceae bacterium]